MSTYAPTQQAPLTLAQAPMPQADAERKRTMHEAWKAYRGAFQKPLKIDKGQPDDNVISNRCAPIVDKGVSFLFGQSLKIEAAEEAQLAAAQPDDDALMEPTPEQPTPAPAPPVPKKPMPEPETPIADYLDGFWGVDDVKMTKLTKMEMNGGVCGNCFVKLIAPSGKMKYPRLVNLDPQLVRIVTDPEDCDIHLAYVIEYPTANDWQKRQIIARVDPNSSVEMWGDNDPDDTWTITNYMRKTNTSGGQQDAWIQVGESEEWDYPFPPIFTCQNLPNPNEPWGTPDLTDDLINQNKVLNFILSCIARILKYHGHPRTIITGARVAQLDVSIDATITLDSPDAKVWNLEMTSQLQGFLNFLADLRADMDEQSRVPAVALGRLESLPKGNISGVALALLFQPLIEKTTLKQRLYGQLICDVSRAALVLGGVIGVDEYEDFEVKLHWQNLLPVDDLAAAQTALILKQLGVSDSTILQELGYDADDEADKSTKEDAKKLTNFSRGQGLAPMPPQLPTQPGQAPAPGQAGVPGQAEGQVVA